MKTAFRWLLAGALCLPSLALAQGVTSARLSGTVSDVSGQPVADANVTVTHVPTNFEMATTTNDAGRYSFPALKAGGPYTVVASHVSHAAVGESGLMLHLAEAVVVDIALKPATVMMEAVAVTAERSATSRSKTGSVVNVSTETIEDLPTIDRSIQDFARLTPQAYGTNIGSSDNTGGINIAGKNSRYNNIQVDGAVLNDAYGLANSGTPGGQANAQPISIDAISEFTVSIAPYDVRQGGFTGGLINAVTRQGSNRLEGSVYSYGRNQGMTGAFDGNDAADFDENTTGFRVGGPIQQDRLFFFVNGEIKRRTDPLDVGVRGSGAATEFGASQAAVDSVIRIARDQYGYDPGSSSLYDRDVQDNKLFVRFDYNLNDAHRLTLRHNYVDALQDRILRDNDDFALSGQAYEFQSSTNQTVLQLNSSLGPNMANEARISFTAIRDERAVPGSPFPEVVVDSERSRIVLGTEQYSQANALDQDILQITNNFYWFRGDHSFTFGTHNEFTSYSNLFIANLYGAYEFPSIADFAAGQPDAYFHSYSRLSDPQPRAEPSLAQIGLYAQDDWKVSEALNVTLGLRIDIPMFTEDPLANPQFEADFGMATDETPGATPLFSPRVGFNLDLFNDRRTILRGGSGLFSGFVPGVWLANQYANTGVDLARVQAFGGGAPAFVADPNDQPRPGDPENGLSPVETSEVNITDPDFKMPQVWRTNLAVDHTLWEGLLGSLEMLYTKTLNDIDYQNLNVGSPMATRAYDGRVVYDGVSRRHNFTNVLLLTNTSEGYQFSLTGQLNKEFGLDPLPSLFGSVAYTWGRSQDVNSGTSFTALSNWQYHETTIDANNTPVGTADFDVRHRFMASLSKRFHFVERFGTTMSLFWESRSGLPFSYIYFTDRSARQSANGDGFGNNDVAYIPASENDVVWRTDCFGCGTYADWQTFVASDPDLEDAVGSIAERNGSRTPWVHQLDFRLAQSVPIVAEQRLQITFDIFNLTNLLNEDWGHQEYINFQTVSPLTFFGYQEAGDGVAAEDVGKPIIGYFNPDFRDVNGDGVQTIEDHYQTDDLLSRWRMQIGLRYNF
jgi:outer membrane receptor for ferrienterochelin and colicin